MKTKIFYLCVFAILAVKSFSIIWEVNQGGGGDFVTVQEGIDAAANLDTVLVYPGIYYENINYNGKSITVGSLNLTTGDEQYISQTIIDGNQNGSCVLVISGEDSTTVLYGVSITNGSGNPVGAGPYGGGIYLKYSELKVINCLIYHNVANCGGGIYARYSNLYLEASKLTNNHAFFSGGGIYSTHYSEIEFNSERLCNIYLNYSSMGNDICKAYACSAMTVNVDTFTVAENALYFLNSTSSTGIPLNDVTLNVQHGKIEQVYSDLYVSTTGNNANSGLNADEPLRTVNYALALLSGDSEEVYTIHVANGTYSKSLNGQCFPLNLPGHISIIGESMENVIWDAENLNIFAYDKNATQSYTIRNITFINGNQGYHFATAIALNVQPTSEVCITYENLTFNNCIRTYGYLLSTCFRSVILKNIIAENNQSAFLRVYNANTDSRYVEMENIKICNNYESEEDSIYNFTQMYMESGYEGTIDVNMKNVEVTDNVEYDCGPDPIQSCSAIYLQSEINLNLVNCTIGNNILPEGASRRGAIYIDGMDNHINIYNSILYGDNHPEIYIHGYNDPNYFSSVSVNNSLIEGGAVGIQNPYYWNQVYWNECNLSEDPLWTQTGDYPYYLQTGSPCIDAGTLDLPEGIELPEYDLAGNPRIYGETVDMGAYEWQGVENSDELEVLSSELSNYPNPFNPTTTIKLQLAEAGKVELSIYNIKGQKVKTLLDCTTTTGTFNCNWNGRNESGKRVASGQYIVKLKVNGEEKASLKMTMLK